MQHGERICPTIETFKAWSQNLGRERVMTTLTSYGTVTPHRQAELIRGMTTSKPAIPIDPAYLAQVITAMQQAKGSGPS